MSESETIKELEAKIKELEGILDQVMTSKAVIAKVTAGPFEHEGKSYYRTSEPSVVVYDKSLLFKKEKQELKLGMEVMIINTIIVDVIPEQLYAKEPPKNAFKLIGWNEIGGLKSQVSRIKETIETPLKNSALAKEFGLNPIKGILLYGPPGCGKTLVAKAIASMIIKDASADDQSFIYIKGAELLSMWVGFTEQRIIEMFRGAREYGKKTGKRAVIFIDEAEAILPARGSRVSSDVDKTIVPTFLSEMDGFDDHSPIMILSTNLPDSLDSAILRPGRIDIKLEVGRPNQSDVEEIFNIHLGKVKCAKDIKELARIGTEKIFGSDAKRNVSGAMVETMVKTAAQRALTRVVTNPKTSERGIVEHDIHVL
jgi:proteasome-associated ATPase